MKKTMDLKKMVITALLIALIGVLGFVTPLGYIPVGPIAITTLCLPVIIGTYLLGLPYGLVLGLAFGATSLIKAITAPSALIAALLNFPLALIPSIFIPRLLIPIFVFLVQKAMSKLPVTVSAGMAAAAGSLTNTVFFLGFLYVLGVQPITQHFGISVAAAGKMLVGIGATNGLPEAAAAVLLCTPIIVALKKAVYK